ncbi:MAG: hypothetical protein NTW59_04205 [Candidatus Diapherotrites archaeon]|nr:hypothetical protein [Candidatus Diapherotrites archaeon]
MEESATQLVQRIAGESGKGSEEVQRLVDEKKERFAGLLTDSGAALMVAKELGVDLQLERRLQRLSIAELQDGMQNIDLVVRVMHVFSPKSFEKNGKKGVLCSLIVGDKTGETRLTLWHNDVKKMQEQGIEKGSALMIQNGYVKSFNGKPQLNLGYSGKIIPNPPEAAAAGLPSVDNQVFKLADLTEGLNDVVAVVRVLRLFPMTEFSGEHGKGKVMNFLVGDETAIIRATAWNDLVDVVGRLVENDLVKLEGAYTKQGLQGVELHLGWRARVLQNPKISGEIPSAMQLLHQKTESKKISELGAESGLVAVSARIVSVNSGQLRYNICPKCGAKVQRMESGMACDNCGEVKEPDIRAVLSVVAEDGSGRINIVAYGAPAEQLIGMRKEELQAGLAKKQPEEIIKEIEQKLAGKQIAVLGSPRQNPYSNELELIARSIEI